MGNAMKRSAYLSAAVLIFVTLSACDSSSVRDASFPNPTAPASPPAPPPPAAQGDITIRSIEPASGARLAVRECEWYSWYVDMCADRAPMTFDVLYRGSVSEAVVTAGFYKNVSRCGIAYSGTPGPSLGGGSESVSFTVSMISLSDEYNRLLCPLPATTTRLVVQLWERGRPAAPLLTKEFVHTYTFSDP
jgi:hypothetical protein